MVTKTTKVIAGSIILINKIIIGTLKELMSITNFFSVAVQREVKRSVPLKRDYWINRKWKIK